MKMLWGKRKQKRKTDNRGVTLLEVVVVIGLMAIMSGLIILGTEMLNGKEAQRCSKALESELNSVRITTMGAKEATARVYKNATDGNYYVEVTSTANNKTKTENKMIGNGKKVVVSYTTQNPDDASATKAELDSAGVQIAFDRSSGAMKDDIRAFYIVQGNRKALLRLYPETGKIVLE